MKIFIASVFLLYLTFAAGAENHDSRKTGSVDIRAAMELENRGSGKAEWLEEADRFMNELLALDVRMYTLINSVGNEESRIALIQKRNLNRKLIYELTMAINQQSSGPGGQ